MEYSKEDLMEAKKQIWGVGGGCGHFLGDNHAAIPWL